MAFDQPSHLILYVDGCVCILLCNCTCVCVILRGYVSAWKPHCTPLCMPLFICVYAFSITCLMCWWVTSLLHYAPFFSVHFLSNGNGDLCRSCGWFSVRPPSFHSNTLTNSIHSSGQCVDVVCCRQKLLSYVSLRKVLLWQIWQSDWTAEWFADYLLIIWLGDWFLFSDRVTGWLTVCFVDRLIV